MIERTLLRADVVYSGLGTPRADGAVVLQRAADERRIVAIESAASAARAFPDAEERQVGFAISPPLVNAHTHLDLSTMSPRRGSYEDFIRAVIAHGRSGSRSAAAAERGIAELLADGVDVVGDIVTSEEVARLLLEHPALAGVAYLEVFGPDPADATGLLAQTEERLSRLRPLVRPGGVRLGLSPHTPHTVSEPLMRGLVALARRERLPLQIHVAESPGETALHRDGTGPLADLMRPFLRDFTPSGLSPVGYLARLGVLEAAPTLVHMVEADEDDVRAVQRAGCVVVHCPRSNDALGCGRFPWERYARHGVTVAIGTDSRGSSPSLSVEEEVAFALDLHGRHASPLALVRAAVKGGYRALGLPPPRVVRGDPADALHLWRLPARARAG